MTQSIKDQLVTVLDTPKNRAVHCYTVEPYESVSRTVDSEGVLWLVRLLPQDRSIYNVGGILLTVASVDPEVKCHMFQTAEVYLTLV